MSQPNATYVVQVDLVPVDPDRLPDLLAAIHLRWRESAILAGVVRLYATAEGINPTAAALAANADAVATAEEADISIGGDVRAQVVPASKARIGIRGA
jgi:hypothetical protein